MKDTQLYKEMLGIENPWKVKAVDLNHDDLKILIQVEYDKTACFCSECNSKMHFHDTNLRSWRHLDSCQYKTIIECEVPRYKCPKHGTQSVAVPWAEKNSRFTLLFERFTIDILLDMATSKATKLLQISWDEADGIKQRAVSRGLGRKGTRKDSFQIGIDEKSFESGHNYMTILVAGDQKGVYIEDIEKGRSEDSLGNIFDRLSDSEKSLIRAVNVDMWDPYRKSIRNNIENADDKIVFDKFHIVGHLNKAVDEVRKKESQEFSKIGKDSLKKTKYIWIKNTENLTENQVCCLNELSHENLKTVRAWRIKESFKKIWLCDSREDAQQYFKQWYGWARRSKLEPIKKFAKMIKGRLKGVMNYFDLNTTNSISETMNSKIQALIMRARGFRSMERFKTDLLFHYGGLFLKPTNNRYT